MEEYAASIKNETGNKFFSVLAALCLGLALTGAVYQSGIEISEDAAIFQKIRKLDVQFVMNNKKSPVAKKKPKPKKVHKKKEIKKASLKEEIKAAEKPTAFRK